MSTAVMGLCWPVTMPPTPKAVLISLADQANDQGACWPSITGICHRTCFGRSAVIDAIAWLERAGILSIEKTEGRTNRYLLNLTRIREQGDTPVRVPDGSPVRHANQSATQTSPPAGLPSPPSGLVPVRQPDQPVRQPDPNRQEPSIEPSRNRQRTPPPEIVPVSALVEAGFDPSTAAEFIAVKAQRKAPLTARAWADHQREAAKAGWSVQQAAEKVMAKTWKGFEARYVQGDRLPAPRAAMSFAERDAALASARAAQFSSSVAARRPAPIFEFEAEVIDVTPRALGR